MTDLSQTASAAWPLPAPGRQHARPRRNPLKPIALALALLAPTIIAAAFVVSTAVRTLAPPDPVAEAAQRVSDLVALYPRLHDSDVADTLFPIAQGISGRTDAGHPRACGITMTAFGPAAPDGLRPQAWQRRYGDCAQSRIASPPADAPSEAPLIVVEVAAGPHLTDPYAVSIAIPQKQALPTLVPGSRY